MPRRPAGRAPGRRCRGRAAARCARAPAACRAARWRSTARRARRPARPRARRSSQLGDQRRACARRLRRELVAPDGRGGRRGAAPAPPSGARPVPGTVGGCDDHIVTAGRRHLAPKLLHLHQRRGRLGLTQAAWRGCAARPAGRTENVVPPPRRGVDGDLAVVILHELPGDREAEARAAGVAVARLVCPVEPLEHVLLGVARDPDAGVSHLQQHVAPGLADDDRHRPALGRVAKGVIDEDHHELADLLAVALDRQAARGIDLEADVLLCRQRHHRLDRLLHHGAHVEHIGLRRDRRGRRAPARAASPRAPRAGRSRSRCRRSPRSRGRSAAGTRRSRGSPRAGCAARARRRPRTRAGGRTPRAPAPAPCRPGTSRRSRRSGCSRRRPGAAR